MANGKRVSLKEIHDILQKSGLRPIDYKHLPYSELVKLAGVKQ